MRPARYPAGPPEAGAARFSFEDVVENAAVEIYS